MCTCIYIYIEREREREVIPSAAELEELAAAGEDDESDLGVAEHGELISFLQQTISSFREGHLTIDLVLDPLQLHSPSPHSLSLSLSLSLSSSSYLQAPWRKVKEIKRRWRWGWRGISSSSPSLSLSLESKNKKYSDRRTPILISGQKDELYLTRRAMK